jgi:hypothetical protein
MSKDNKEIRVFSLEGGCNFRDIGGYPTADGRTMRWGQVFRAGVLSYLSDRDHQTLAPLRVRTICDLRQADEREQEPTRWSGGQINRWFSIRGGWRPAPGACPRRSRPLSACAGR